MKRVGVMASGNGSNFEALLKGIKAEVVLLLVNKDNAYVTQRAERNGVPVVNIGLGHFKSPRDRDQRIIGALREQAVDLVVLAVYLGILSPEVIRAYPGRIVNIHPSLIPKYAGKGYYGSKVHEAVILNREPFTGVTVHYVDEGIDTGEIISQEKVPVLPTDTPDSLGKRVLEVEHRLLVETVNRLLEAWS